MLNAAFLASIVVLGVLYNHSATALHSASVSQCRANNVARQQDIAIWNQFLSDLVPAPAKLSPKQRQQLDQINALIRVKDTPRNCVKVYQP